MSKKKIVWPVAKIREDGCPAVWLSHGVWNVVRGGLVTSYLTNRQYHGRSEARIAIGKRDSILDSWRTEKQDAETALEVFRIGFKHNEPDMSIYKDCHCKPITPDGLVELGDKREAEAYNEELEKHREGPKVARDKAGNVYCEINHEFYPVTGEGRKRLSYEMAL